MKDYENFTLVTMSSRNDTLKTITFKRGLNVEFYPGNNHATDSINIYEDEKSMTNGKVEINENIIKFTIIYNNDMLTMAKEFKIRDYAESVISTKVTINFNKLVSDIYEFLIKCYNFNSSEIETPKSKNKDKDKE